MQNLLQYLPLAVVLILELVTWFVDSSFLSYTADHLIVLVLLYISYQLINLQEDNSALVEKLKSTISLLSDREFKNTNLLSLINYGYSTFDPKDFPKIWASLMWNTEVEFLSSNHIHPRHLWSNQFAEAALLIQQAKIANDNVAMSRLFIYEDDEEFQLLIPAMEANRKAGVGVYHISRHRIDEIPHLRDCLDPRSKHPVETLAFNLIDGYAVLLYDLDPESRMIDSFRLAVDRDEYTKYKSFYLDAIRSATKFEGLSEMNVSA